MAVKTIETRAIISAQDKTGATFAQVAQKLRHLEAAAAQASKRMDGMTRGMSGVWQAQQRHADVARRMSSIAPVVGSRGFFPTVAAVQERAAHAAMVAGAAGTISVPVIKQIVKQASSRLHERLRMENAGMTAAEIADAHEKMAELSRKYKPIGQTSILHMLRNMRSVVGAYDEAAHIAEPLLKLRIVEQHAHPHASAEELDQNFDKLVKSAELMGVTGNLGKFHNYMEGIAKALNVFGDTIRPHEFFHAAQYARAAAMHLSPEFVAGVLPTLIQHHGGAQAGTALGAFYSSIVGGRMSSLAVDQMLKIGLVDPKKIVKTPAGKRIAPGGIYGSDLARTDPDRWTREFLFPALSKHGITDASRIAEVLARVFSSRVSSQFVTEMTTQSQIFDKDRGLIRKSKGLDASNKIMAEDFDQSVKGLKNAVDAVTGVLGKDILPPLSKGSNSLAESLHGVSSFLEKNQAARTHGLLGGLGGLGLGAHLTLAGVGGYFGGAGVAAAAGAAFPFVAGGGTVLLLSYAYQQWREQYLKENSASAAFARMRRLPSDFTYSGMRNRLIVNSLGLEPGDRASWQSGFALNDQNWARGDAPFEFVGGRLVKRRGKKPSLVGGQIVGGGTVPGVLGFGFGPGGVNESGAVALHLPPRNPAGERRATEAARLSELLSALREHTKVDVNVTAEPMRIEVTASGELVRLAGEARTATREAKLSAKANASGPGSTGSTDFGNQH